MSPRPPPPIDAQPPPARHPGPELIELDAGLYRRDGRTLTTAGAEVTLTPIEGRLLEYLFEKAGQTLSHAQLLRDVWGYAPGVQSRALYTTINRLRMKIERDPSHPRHVLAVASTGYRFEREAPPPAAPVDALIGRREELDQLDQAVLRSRIVTVLAPGGMGKTRLVREWMLRFSGASVFCDLSAAIPADPVAQIGPLLKSRGALVLVLDNAETVTAALAPLVGGWLGTAPEARVLLTTREALKIRGEQRFPLGPLASEGGHSDGVSLFLARLSEAAPDLDVGEADRAVIAAIVGAVEGIPLAIELAARRGPVMSLASIQEQLGQRLRLLSAPGVEGRHRSMRSCIDASYEILSPWEQAAFSQLSVFVGGFGLESAEAVLDLSAFPEAPWALDLVQSLLERSLIQASMSDGTRMFRLLDTLRDYAAERLRAVPGAWERAELRHGRRYGALGEQEALDALRRAGGLERRALLARERDELVAACRRALGRGDGVTAATAALAVSLIFHTAGPAAEGAALLEAVARIPELPGPLRARIGLNLGLLLRSSGRPVEAKAAAEAALAIATEVGAKLVEGRALGAVGLRLRDDNDLPGAERMLRQSIECCRVAGDEIGESIALCSLSTVLIRVGRVREALFHHQRGHEMIEARGDPFSLPSARSSNAQLLFAAGDLEPSLLAYERAGVAARSIGDTRNIAFIGTARGDVLIAAGRLDEAEASMLEALDAFEKNGDTWASADAWVGLAELLCLQGRLAAAEERALTAVRLTAGRGAQREYDARFVLFLVLLHTNRLKEAEELLDQATANATPAQQNPFFGRLVGRALLAFGRGDRVSAADWVAQARATIADAEFFPVGTAGRALRALEARLAAEPQ
jgi:predicted ATPase/DNA-binding winged helix-turn-helix (wHTH) protein